MRQTVVATAAYLYLHVSVSKRCMHETLLKKICSSTRSGHIYSYKKYNWDLRMRITQQQQRTSSQWRRVRVSSTIKMQQEKNEDKKCQI